MQPVPGIDQVTCSYCGTTSFIERARAPLHAPVVVVKASPPWLFVALGVAAALTLGAAGLVYALLLSAPAPVTSPPSRAVEEAGSASAPAGSPISGPVASPIEIQSDFPPLLADLNADGVSDVVARIGGSGSEHYAAFDGKSGRELSRTPAVPDENPTAMAIASRRLFVAARNGQLTSYGLGDGSLQWSTALGARVSKFCGAKDPSALLVVTDDERNLSIDTTTGRQSPTKEACLQVLSRVDGDRDPRDRHDYSAPLGTESYRCGGVTVMGSQNYTLADQCLVRARIDTDRLDGLIGHRLWKVGQDWLVFGIRKPGARVPIVGLLSRGRVAWKSEVPLDNPLEAEEGSPQYVGLTGDAVVLAYKSSKERRPFVTAFGVSDGVRRWTTPLPEHARSINTLVTSSNRVFIQSGHELLFLDSADGKVVISIGKSD